MYAQDLLNGVKLWKKKNKGYKENKELLLLFEQYEDDSYDVSLWVKEDMSHHGVIYTFTQISSELRAKSLHKEIKMILQREFPNHTFVEDDEILKMPAVFRLAI